MAVYSDAQLQALQDALATGELEVEYEGRKVRYRSVAELRTAISTVQQALAQAAGNPPIRRIKVYMTKDL